MEIWHPVSVGPFMEFAGMRLDVLEALRLIARAKLTWAETAQERTLHQRRIVCWLDRESSRVVAGGTAIASLRVQ